MEILDTANGGHRANVKGTNGAAHVAQHDTSGNEITPAFSPSNTYNLTATSSSQNQSLGSAKSIRITSVATATATTTFIRIKFVASGSDTAAITDVIVNVAGSLQPEVFYVPANTGFLAYIRDSASGSDIAFQVAVG